MICSDSVNIEREKENLLCLIKLTLKTLIDESTSLTILDEKNDDVTNFVLTLERLLNFRMRANWLSERRYFWDFVRPACFGSARQNIIERVEEISKNKSVKEKGRIWIKFAIMEKKLSELLKLIISDCHLVRKFYHDDSILTSSQMFILCDQLAGLSAIDFSFCFKQDGSSVGSLLLQSAEMDVIDLTPFLSYQPKMFKRLSKNESNNEENEQPLPKLTAINELKLLNPREREMISLDKHQLEVEQRKYFEELLKHRDRELEQLKNRYETLKSERENEIVLMENIIVELQFQLRVARDQVELKREKSQSSSSTPPTKRIFNFAHRKINSPPTPTNEETDDSDDAEMRPIDAILMTQNNESSSSIVDEMNPNSCNEFVCSANESSRRSSDSTTTSDDQYELVQRFKSNCQNFVVNAVDFLSSPEMISSTTSFSCSSVDENDEIVESPDRNEKTSIGESGRFQSIEMSEEQTNLLEEASTTT